MAKTPEKKDDHKKVDPQKTDNNDPNDLKTQEEQSEVSRADGIETISDPTVQNPPNDAERKEVSQGTGKGKEKTFKIKVLRGAHREGGKTYTKTDGVFESKSDLVARFGTEKFAYGDK